MIKRTFLEKGINYASQLALLNIKDLQKVLDWNIENNILLYRMSSEMIPWMSEYELNDLPDFESIKNILFQCGKKVMGRGHRITFHPGPFNVLASSSEIVIKKTIKELRQHGEIMDLLGLPQTPFAKINIHLGGSYGNKTEAIKRFCENIKHLPANVLRRLTIENDDKLNMFSVKDLYEVYERSGIPIVFDYLHHQFCTGGLTEEEAFSLALKTWPKEITPLVHSSSSKKMFEDASALPTAHADFIYSPVNLYGSNADIMLEAKAKEKAVLKYIENYRIYANF